MNRNEQFKTLGLARDSILKWAKNEGINLFRVEYVVGFGEDFGVWVWLFYKKAIMVNDYEKNGKSAGLKLQFLRILRSLGYHVKYLNLVDFKFDSDESVQKNYGGSYQAKLHDG